jgi:hypothetical protein
MNVRARGLQKDIELFEQVDPNTRNPLKMLALVRKDVCSYEYFHNIEDRINFNFLVKFAYISFVFNLVVSILLPMFTKHEE